MVKEIRSGFATRLGFVLAVTGSAVGLANIWRFPYVAGEHGGGAFLLIYLLAMFTIGLSLMLAEMTIGRASERNPVGAFRRLKGGPWVVLGYTGVIAAFLILSVYSVVGGWTLAYALKAVAGQLAGADAGVLSAVFTGFASSPVEPLVYHAAFMVATVVIVAFGINGGIEWAAKFFMPILLGLLLLLVWTSVSLPGAAPGIVFFLIPDFSNFTIDTVIAAFGQAFFSLSLGVGTILVYGSYVSRKVSLFVAAMSATAVVAVVAILAGLLIIPAIFVFGLDPAAGPGLAFVVLPLVFNNLAGGDWLLMAFFLMLALAALTSAIALMECVVAYAIEEKNALRRHAAIGTGLIAFILGVPSSMAMGTLGDVTIFGKNIFAALDYLTSTIVLPIIGIGVAIFAAWVAWPRIKEEASGWEKASLPLIGLWRGMLGVFAPIAILWVLWDGL